MAGLGSVVSFGLGEDEDNEAVVEIHSEKIESSLVEYDYSGIDQNDIELIERHIKRIKDSKGFKITYEPEFLRHFTAHFEPLK